jgi:hypothetical protein
MLKKVSLSRLFSNSSLSAKSEQSKNENNSIDFKD